jgi:SOS response associated peptidase (SRAP)
MGAVIPRWAKELPKIRPINARAESLVTKPYYRHLVGRNHCLIPASGFYEWERIEGKKKGYKTPLMKEIKICYPPDRICSFICALFHIKPAIILPVTYVIAFL